MCLVRYGPSASVIPKIYEYTLHLLNVVVHVENEVFELTDARHQLGAEEWSQAERHIFLVLEGSVLEVLTKLSRLFEN